MPMGFPVKGLDSGMAYRAEADDIFVCTYPKCGTTWVQYIVYLLIRQRTLDADDSLSELFPHLEEVGREAVAALPRRRLIKTHLPRDMTPWSSEARYVVVLRNPFDCVVSFFHHTRGFPRHYDFAEGRFDTFFECFLRGEVDFGDYFDHLLPWYAAGQAPNVLVLTYESLKADAAAEVKRLAQFLGSPAAELAVDRDALARVLEESSFASMSRNQQRWSSERPAELPFVRKGRVGDWQDLMSPPQIAALVEKFDQRTAGTDIPRLWSELLGEARQRARPE